MITQNHLKEALEYNPDTGIFIWKINPSMGTKSGSIAGSVNDEGYIKIAYKRKIYSAHRLAWLYMYGSMPEDKIDHRNGIKSDNRIINLRSATHMQNLCNQRKPMSNNTTGYLGVSYSKKNRKFVAQIRINGRLKYLGSFSKAIEAHEAYLKVKRQVHDFCTI